VTGGAEATAWSDAIHAATLCAVDPAGLGGVALRALPGPVRDRWLETLRRLSGSETPLRRVPAHTDDDRLIGGLDLAATLRAERPVLEPGLLATADGGIVVLAMAERMEAGMAAVIDAALDQGRLTLERDGFTATLATRIGVVALDEGIDAEEAPPASLMERLAFHLDLGPVALAETDDESSPDPAKMARARARLPEVAADDEAVRTLCTVAMALGITSLRAPRLALRVARAAAAMAGRTSVVEDDVALAARLVLAPRAACLPQSAEQPPPETAPSPPESEKDAEDNATADPPDGEQGQKHETPDEESDEASDSATEGGALEERVIAAAEAAIPPDLLARLKTGETSRGASALSGRAGAKVSSGRRGRRVGTRAGLPRGGHRLDLIATLRAAAPWQALRRRDDGAGDGEGPRRIAVRPEDFRVVHRQQRRRTTTIFAVDASGSTALHRLAEAKGAVELVLAECYVRRDQVALVAFRGAGAELLLPPTRSLVRAKRSLAGLPGGGATPLAAGIDSALELADHVRRRGDTPVVVLLTDGSANRTRDGRADRAQARSDAEAAARNLRAAGVAAIVVDTAPRPQARVRDLADVLGGRYVPLPYADARTLSDVVRAR